MTILSTLKSNIVLYLILFSFSLLFAAGYDSDLFKAQKRLKELGYNVGAPNGTWNEKTCEALIEFQGKNKLTVSGELDAPTIKLLDINPSGKTSQTTATYPKTNPGNVKIVCFKDYDDLLLAIIAIPNAASNYTFTKASPIKLILKIGKSIPLKGMLMKGMFGMSMVPLENSAIEVKRGSSVQVRGMVPLDDTFKNEEVGIEYTAEGDLFLAVVFPFNYTLKDIKSVNVFDSRVIVKFTQRIGESNVFLVNIDP